MKTSDTKGMVLTYIIDQGQFHIESAATLFPSRVAHLLSGRQLPSSYTLGIYETEQDAIAAMNEFITSAKLVWDDKQFCWFRNNDPILKRLARK